MVEKKLKLQSKKDIEKLGVDKFMKICRESAALNKDLWLEVYDNLGSYYSSKEPYLTYDNSYIESAWWAFNTLWNKDMVYEGKKPVFWCPKCQTALAGYEVTDSYKNVRDPSIFIKFKVKGTKDDNLLIYTTTPWTLPANVAIACKDDEDYVKVKTEKDGNLILAKNCLKTLKDLDVKFEVLETFKGKKLVGTKYESILDVPIQRELDKNPNALKVYASIPILKERVASKIGAKKGISTKDVHEHFVSVEEGTGLVHTAPGHGKTDNEVGIHYNIPMISPLDDECKFTDEVGQFKGEFVKQADHAISEVLHKTGRLLHYSTIEHSYPLCWRCKAPLIFRLSNQWFLKIESVKKKMLKANEDINWQPEFARERLRNWITNAEDWNFSRQRYWGIPIPIWKCECGEVITIGSFDELKKKSIKKIPDNFDLHTVNNVHLKCKCGKNVSRINDIFDVWFDSGCAPFASLGYPFQNKKLFEEHYPVSRINESQDQIRGWFYHLMFCGIAVFNKEPYKTISMPGWVLDKNAEKMSKSLGNVIGAKDALEEVGADALRFYYCWDVDPSSTQKFNMETVKNEMGKVFNTLWNLHVFVLSQADKLEKLSVKELEDKWIISRLNTTIKEVSENLESFNLHLAGRVVQNFLVDDLSRTYVQLIRDRLIDDKNPLSIINHCLTKTLILIASISPFITEKIYQNMKKLNRGLKASIHLEELPKAENSNLKLEEDMDVVQEVIAAALSCRDKSEIGVRWPLKKLIIEADKEVTDKVKHLEHLLKKQVNVKQVVYGKIEYDLKVKPNFRNLGKDFGTETGSVAELINQEKDKIKDLLKTQDKIKIKTFELRKDHFEIEKVEPKDTKIADFKGGIVLLDITTNPELEKEGFVREIIRRIQQLRKDSGFKKEQRIKLGLKTDMNLEAFVDDIKNKVGAKSMEMGSNVKSLKFKSEANIKNRKVVIYIENE